MNKLSVFIRQAVNWGGRVKRLNLVLVVALLLSLTSPFTGVPEPALADNDPPRADPELLRLAGEHLDDVFRVIVQREVKNKDLPDDEPEAEVTKAGGQVKKQLKLIESFSAELTGKEIIKLAKHNKVKWISLDAPLYSTALPGFGATGKVTTAIGSANDTGNAMALQSDGKIVVAGLSFTGSYSDFAVVRYNSNGSLDTSFGTGGKVTTAVSSTDDSAFAVAIQSDGKIVVAGHAKVGSYMDFAVVRYNSNGSLDTTFNTTGKVTTAIGTLADSARGAVIQPDGKIVVVGMYTVGTNNDDIALVRYNPNGSLDTTFGTSGKVKTTVSSLDDRAYAVSLQSDGKIVIAGMTKTSSTGKDFYVSRYNTNGSLDTTFGTSGKVTTSMGTTDDEAAAITLQPDGKIVVTGTMMNGTNNDVVVVRYNSNGSLDTSFDGDGKMITTVSANNDFGRSVRVQPDGKILVGGFAFGGSGNGDFVVLRYDSNGSLDTAFGGTGIVTTGIGDASDDVYGVGIQSDGKLVAAGYSITGGNVDFAVVRYNTDGGLDCSQCIDIGNLTNTYIRTVGADRVWNAPGYLQGQGVTVAVIDSGFANNADFQVYGGGNSRVITSTNVATGTVGTIDGYGHGTFVVGIIGGSGNGSNGARIGVAPGVNLINVKVADSNGMSYASDLVDGLQWIYDNRAAYNIKVVNISMNSTITESYHTSPIDAAVEILWFNGVVVVVSAGNNGAGALYPPANDPFVITVGATDDVGTANLNDDVVASFSAYGTTEAGFAKPDLVAPGRNILSLLASTNAGIYVNHPDNRVDSYMFRMSGTSMSAPMVSGAVALLLQDEPNLNPDQVKYRLMATANKSWPGYDAAKAGAGYLDIYAAVNGTTTQTANTGVAASNMLTTGTDPINWGSVQWGSVQWGSVQWGSVQWGSVQWGSDYWGP